MKQLLKNRVISWGLKIVLTLLFFIYVNRSITTEKIRIAISCLSPQYIIAAFFFSMVGLYYQVKRWEIILKFQHFSVEGNVAWKTLLWGNLLAFITPGRFGELFRGIQISKTRRGDSLFAVIIDKLFIITTVLFAGLLTMVIMKIFLGIPLTRDMKIFILAAFVLCLIGLILLSTGKVFNETHTVSRFFNHILKNLPRIFQPAGKRAVLFSLIAHSALIAQTVILLRMFGCGAIGLNIMAICMAYGLMPFIPIAHIAIGNMGVREGSFTLFLTHLGATCSNSNLTIGGAALGTSILILIMNLVLPAFIGLVWYLCAGSAKNSAEER